ncbi:MAG: 50S ribosomal protein L11 methyltransferase [Bacteroidota bacterium]
MTDYLQVSIQASPPLQEALIAVLADVGFESFEEQEHLLLAYIPADEFRQSVFDHSLAPFSLKPSAITLTRIPPTNWNAVWESNFPPTEIAGFCQVVASFHSPKEGFDHTLLIDPKMAFGTGHHETTRLMIRQMKGLEWTGLSVLDMGCGTGILGMLAAKMGAKRITGIDIDENSTENTRENVLLNGGIQMDILTGDLTAIPATAMYDVILANINRNVLLADIPYYKEHLHQKGKLIISGFLSSDQEQMEACLSKNSLQIIHRVKEGKWEAWSCKK